GAVSTGGGLITQAVLGVHTRLIKDYGVKLAAGQTLTPNGDFNGTLLEVGLSKSFNYASPTANNEHNQYLLTPANRMNSMGIHIVNRTYFTPDADQRYDKGGKSYDAYFNLLGFVFTKEL